MQIEATCLEVAKRQKEWKGFEGVNGGYVRDRLSSDL